MIGLHRIIQPQKEERFDLTLQGNKSRRMVSRNIYHLLIPFQYDFVILEI